MDKDSDMESLEGDVNDVYCNHIYLVFPQGCMGDLPPLLRNAVIAERPVQLQFRVHCFNWDNNTSEKCNVQASFVAEEPIGVVYKFEIPQKYRCDMRSYWMQDIDGGVVLCDDDHYHKTLKSLMPTWWNAQDSWSTNEGSTTRIWFIAADIQTT